MPGVSWSGILLQPFTCRLRPHAGTDTQQEGRIPMNKDQVSGKVEQVAGKVKQGVGEAVGNEDLANRGTADQVKGAAKETWGNVKDAANKNAEDKAHDTRQNISDKVEDTKNRVNEKIDAVKEQHRMNEKSKHTA
jgi:uncharacterized protein YjbJ (UPF0337 family)